MGDPLLTPALVGTAVSLLLTEVIDAAKGAIKIKESCKALKVKVDKIVPLLKIVEKNSTNWNQVHIDWLSEFKTILITAQSVLEECLKESRGGKWVRLMKVWQWRKLPSCLKQITYQIDEARLNAILATLGVNNQSSNSIYKQSKSKVDFSIQSSPPLIVGVEKSFNNLKTSIIASYTKSKPTFLGLQGRGGAGKTLLAGQLNNDKDIRAIYGTKGILWITIGLDARISDLYKIMGKFLNDGVFEEEYAHRNQEDQRTYLWNAFAKKKMFLILDDVWGSQCDHREMMYWLNIASAPGSTTLITTRSATVLSKVHAEVEVVLLLSDEDSWTLFCAHAFKDGILPSTILEALAREVCKECKGLPLALKVIGSAMLDKNVMAEWRLALSELKQSKPILDSNVDDELYHRLQLSYNDLKHDETKTCFLYCAAFPEDYKIQIRDLCKIWIAEGLFGILDGKKVEDVAIVHLEILVKRSMVDWNRERGYIVVHDILRDLAIHIINKSKPDDCGYKCFFQSGKVLTSLSTNKSLNVVQRISFIQSNILEWPNQLHAPNLRVCLLSQMSSRKRRLFISEAFLSNLPALQYLDLSKNHFCEELPKMYGLRSLLVLNLDGCGSLSELPESISECKFLTELCLRGCKSLKVLPQSIGGLKCLTKVDLFGCGSLTRLPESIGELNILKELHLRGCKFLQVLPQSIRGLRCLPKLDLNGCGSLSELPESIGELNTLEELNLQRCKSLKALPQNIGGLKCLLKLNLQGCGSLSELPESIEKLDSFKELYLRGCASLRELPQSIGGLKCLTNLDLYGCRSLNELPNNIGKLDTLNKLYLGGCSSIKVLPQSIGGLKHLTKLILQGCGSISELPESIGELKTLKELYLRGCKSLKVLPQSMRGLKCLSKLDLRGSRSLSELPESIGELDTLIELYLRGCASLKMLPQSIGGLKCLTKLDLYKCESLSELPESIGKLNTLEELYLRGCTFLKMLPQSIGGLKCLTKLDLYRCESLSELPESITELDTLRELYLRQCISLKVLPQSIGGLKCLTKLDLYGCGSLSVLPESISKLDTLNKLYFGGC